MNTLYSSSLKNDLLERCSDEYPIQIVLNNGMILECMCSQLDFYDDYIKIEARHSADVKIILKNDSDFSRRSLWIPYHAISLFCDAAS